MVSVFESGTKQQFFEIFRECHNESSLVIFGGMSRTIGIAEKSYFVNKVLIKAVIKIFVLFHHQKFPLTEFG